MLFICFHYFNLELFYGNPRLASGKLVDWFRAPNGELIKSDIMETI